MKARLSGRNRRGYATAEAVNRVKDLAGASEEAETRILELLGEE